MHITNRRLEDDQQKLQIQATRNFTIWLFHIAMENHHF